VPIDPDLDPPPALAILAARFELTFFETDLLLLCVAFELDVRIADLCARAHDDSQRPYPTFALALTLFDDPAWDVTSVERPLRHWHLIDLDRRSALPMSLSPLRSDARTVDFVKGFNRIDERLATLVSPLPDAEASSLSASQLAVVDRLVSAYSQSSLGRPLTIQLTGPDERAKLFIAAVAGVRLHRSVWQLRAAWFPPGAAETDELARLWLREAVLAPTLLVLDIPDGGDERDVESGRMARRFLSRRAADALLLARSPVSGLDDPNFTLEVDLPTPSEQQLAWQRALPHGEPAAGELAAQFRLDLASIQRIADGVKGASSDTPAAERLWNDCCSHLAPRLETLATRIDPRATWDDIVLPAEQQAQLRQIAQHVRGRYKVYEEWGFAQKMNRGLGISALFTGDSGTGKTMAAEVLSNDLRLPLYRIDLSAVVSKYIGETERNLRQLFDVADCGGFILFFDEADALFGKRSEVRDSHDRYANIEVNYLLQRIEAFRGLTILATNVRAALDFAFLRRLRFIVSFPYPSAADRKLIWERTFSPRTPTRGLDLERLGRLNATGGVIRNACLDAAFESAANDGVVTMPLLLTSLKREYRKLNRPINEAEFGASDGALL
jgi:hypothetical protein